MADPRGLRVLHIGPDSPFVQFAARTFESVAPGANSYIVVSRTADAPVQSPPPAGEVTVVPNSMKGVLQLLRRRFDADIVIAHSMTPHAAAVFSRVARGTATVWSGWGYDYYGSGTGDDHGLYGPLTRGVVDLLAAGAAGRRSLADRALGPWRAFARGLVRRAAARADFFSAPVPTDEAVFRSRFPGFRGRYAQLSYASLEASFQSAAATRPAGEGFPGERGILVGNSATPSNNHLEAFELLAGRDLGGRRVVVPLSYGDPAYRDVVIEHGRRTLGEAFVPVVDRLPLDKYNAIVSGCDVVIMNTRRQQALGNIGTALQAGAELILDEVNPVHAFLREEGVVLRSTAELRREGGAFGTPLTADEVARNRRFVESFWGARQVAANAAALLDAVR